MPTQFQVAVTIDGGRLIIEIPEKLLSVFRDEARVPGQKHTRAAVSSNAVKEQQLSERQLVDQKQPQGHGETVAVLAFCLREAGMIEFTADDIRRAYIRAGVRPPKVVAQALRDAKNKYDLIESGAKRSTFRLSPHGERTVMFGLPAMK